MADSGLGEDLPAHLNGPAGSEVRRSVAKFQADLLEEAGRLEAASSSSSHPEITSSMVRDADLLLRRGYRRPRQSAWLVAARVGAVVSGFLTGLLADFDKLSDRTYLVWFILLMAVTLVLSIYTTMKE